MLEMSYEDMHSLTEIFAERHGINSSLLLSKYEHIDFVFFEPSSLGEAISVNDRFYVEPASKRVLEVLAELEEQDLGMDEVVKICAEMVRVVRPVWMKLLASDEGEDDA